MMGLPCVGRMAGPMAMNAWPGRQEWRWHVMGSVPVLLLGLIVMRYMLLFVAVMERPIAMIAWP